MCRPRVDGVYKLVEILSNGMTTGIDKTKPCQFYSVEIQFSRNQIFFQETVLFQKKLLPKTRFGSFQYNAQPLGLHTVTSFLSVTIMNE